MFLWKIFSFPGFVLLCFNLCFKTSHAGCPFKRSLGILDKKTEEDLYKIYHQSLYTKGLDEETKIRSEPWQKNNYGHCPNDKCVLNSRFRTFNGICNNVVTNKNFGRSSSILNRLIPSVKKLNNNAKFNQQLPNPRKISSSIHGGSEESNKKDQRFTLHFMQWGQFIAHDLSLTPMFRLPNGSLENCSQCKSGQIKSKFCNPIPVPPNDPFFLENENGMPKCLEFVRSQSTRKKEQLNKVTAWLDASHIYGSFLCHSKHLRSGSGKLKTLPHPLSPNLKPLLPRVATNHECLSQTGLCFSAGDDRINVQPGLVVMHTIWVWEHNRIADKLSLLNPHWSSDEIYFETRKIIIALIQHITYNEYLPKVLGPDLIELYNLKPNPDYFKDYDEKCDPGIFNEFSVAAFRFGHSQIPESFDLNIKCLYKNYSEENLPLKHHFNDPDITMSPHFFDETMKKFATSPSMETNRFINSAVRNHLRVNRDQVDLASMTIQRGRDHEISGYIEYENFCSKDIQRRIREKYPSKIFPNMKTLSKNKIKNFIDLGQKWNWKWHWKFQQNYKHVQDIDLFPGGMSEPPVQDGIIGKTFGCIIGLQFEKLRKCDRFWYETDDLKIGFTKKQLEAIKKVNLASIICNNLDQHSELQKSTFELPNENSNPKIPCHLHESLDLSAWKQ